MEAAPAAAFCRVTHLAFLRLLTNRAIMAGQTLSPLAAWKKASDFLALPEVRFCVEPAGLEEQLAAFCVMGKTSPNLWTDAYLAAFARCAGFRLVTFDAGLAAFPKVDVLLLKA